MRRCFGLLEPAGQTSVIVQHRLIRIFKQVFAVVEVQVPQRMPDADHVHDFRVTFGTIREYLTQIAKLHRTSSERVEHRIKLGRVQAQILVQTELELHLDVFALGANHDLGISPKRHDISVRLLFTVLDIEIRAVRAVNREIVKRFGDDPVGIAVQTLNHRARQSLRFGVVQMRGVTTHAELAAQELRHDIVGVEAVPFDVHEFLKHLARASARRTLVPVGDEHLREVARLFAHQLVHQVQRALGLFDWLVALRGREHFQKFTERVELSVEDCAVVRKQHHAAVFDVLYRVPDARPVSLNHLAIGVHAHRYVPRTSVRLVKARDRAVMDADVAMAKALLERFRRLRQFWVMIDCVEMRTRAGKRH